MESVYRWTEEITQDTESPPLIKILNARIDAVLAHLVENHPYELPEVAAVSIDLGFAEYLH